MKPLKTNQCIWRWIIYSIGLMCCALGTALSSKTNLGISCVVSMPYAIARASGLDSSFMVFLVFTGMAVAQIFIRGKHRQWRDLLQIPVSMAYSAFLSWFSTLFSLQPELMWQRLALMAVSICIMGLGVCLSVNMELVPNAADGLVYTIGQVTGKDIGLVKNIVDIVCVTISLAVDLLFSGKIETVGLGTVCAMIFLGRAVYAANRLLRKWIRQKAGLSVE